MLPGVGSSEKTLKVTSDRFMFLAFDVCWSRGPDGLGCSDDLRTSEKASQEFGQYSGS